MNDSKKENIVVLTIQIIWLAIRVFVPAIIAFSCIFNVSEISVGFLGLPVCIVSVFWGCA